MWLLIYILGFVATFGIVVLDDTRGTFRDVYDKAYNEESKPDPDDSSRGWTATWIALAWPATMTIFFFIMLVAYFKVYVVITNVVITNPFNMLYDQAAKWMSGKR